MPYTFIIIGFLASVVSGYFGSELAFVFYLLGSFKFIGLFMLILATKQLKIVPLILVIGSIVSSSLAGGMFHDLITWFVFTAAVFAIKYKFSFRTKIIGLSAFVFIVLTIQLLKSSYRTETGTGQATAGAETFAKLYQKESEQERLI